MATTPATTPPSVRRPPTKPGGWIVFAAVMALICGSFGAIWGLAAVLNDEVVTVGGRGVIVWDFTAWGWAHIIAGAIVIVTGLGLLRMHEWARWTAVALAAIQAILEVGVLTAFPLWSLAVIAIDVIVIYQLTARWQTT